MKIMIVNNTGKALLPCFNAAFVAFAKGVALPEEIADLFSAYIVVENGYIKVIVSFA